MLDTNVLMHDPTSLFRFEEHDIFLPMETLEELDNHKKGMSEVARNARQASRFLDEIVTAGERPDQRGRHRARTATTRTPRPGACSCRPRRSNGGLAADPRHRQGRQPDPRRSCTACERHPEREVILVSKDINMRIKARALGLAAEDYFNDKVLEDTDLLYTGAARAARPISGTATARDMESWQKDGHTFYRVRGPLCPSCC